MYVWMSDLQTVWLCETVAIRHDYNPSAEWMAFFFWSSRDIVAHIPQSTIEKIEKITYWSVCSHAFTSFLSAISLPPFLVSATATSPDTMSDCQRDLKLYIFGGGVCPAKFQLQRYNPQWTEYRGDEGGGCSTIGVFTNPLFNPYVILSVDIVR